MTGWPFSADGDESWQCYRIDAEDQVTEAVVFAVAAVSNDPPDEMVPLYGAVESGALDRLVAHADSRDADIAVAFEYNGCQVVVNSPDIHVRQKDV